MPPNCQTCLGDLGDNTLTGNPNTPYPGNQMYGDAYESLINAQGGNDVMTGDGW